MSDDLTRLRELPPRFWITCPECDNTGECHCDQNGCSPHSSSSMEPPDDYFECDDCGGTRVCQECKGAGVVPLSDEEAREMLAAEPEPDVHGWTQVDGTFGATMLPTTPFTPTAEPEPDPAPYVVTDAMIEAARKEYYAFHGHVSSSGEGMRAALEAAERARRTGGQG